MSVVALAESVADPYKQWIPQAEPLQKYIVFETDIGITYITLVSVLIILME